MIFFVLGRLRRSLGCVDSSVLLPGTNLCAACARLCSGDALRGLQRGIWGGVRGEGSRGDLGGDSKGELGGVLLGEALGGDSGGRSPGGIPGEDSGGTPGHNLAALFHISDSFCHSPGEQGAICWEGVFDGAPACSLKPAGPLRDPGIEAGAGSSLS